MSALKKDRQSVFRLSQDTLPENASRNGNLLDASEEFAIIEPTQNRSMQKPK